MQGCPACESYLPVFRKVAERYAIPAFAVDSNAFPEAADKYKIKVTPTTLLLKWGRVTKRFEGEGTTADVEKLFRWAEK